MKLRVAGMVFALWILLAGRALAQVPPEKPRSLPIPVKVVVVAMFERGEDTGDAPGEYQYWVEREHLDKVIEMPAGYHHVRMNEQGVLGLLTGVGTARATASVMALGLDPRFDLSRVYWIVAGIGGGAPSELSLGSAVWVDRVLDGDLAFEIDARQIPDGWTTGYVPLRRSVPFEQPMSEQPGLLFTLNPQLTSWAYELTRAMPLGDSDDLKKARERFPGFPAAQRPPFVLRGDQVSSSTFWHGSKMEEWAKEWVRYYTAGKGNYVVCAMEDSGTLQALTFLQQAGRVDLRRVLVLRTVSNFDREPAGASAAESLKSLAAGNYSAYFQSLDAAEKVGDRVVREILAHWEERENSLPHAP